MAKKTGIMIHINENPIVMQYTKQGIQGATGATGPQGRDGDVWELRLTMTGAPDGTLTMELYQNGTICEEQHFASVMYMTNNGTGYALSNEWSRNITGTYSFTYTGMRSFFVTIYDDAFKERVICHNSVNYGKAATIQVGNVQQGQTARVTNSGTVYNAILDFVLPKGDAGTVRIGTTTTLPAGSKATVVNVGTVNDAILNFGIPNGGGSGARVEANSEGNNIILDAGAIYTPSISAEGVISWSNNAALPNPASVRLAINPRGIWSSTATYTRFDTVMYQGSAYMALKATIAGTAPTNTAYWIKIVEKGDSGSVRVGTTTTGRPNTSASVTNSGTVHDAVLNFTIPQGAQGIQGPSGTMRMGTVRTLPEGSNATVENVGTSTNAIWNFGIPRGDTGHFDAEFIADYFDVNKNYFFGDYVIYGGSLYRFTTDHPAGSWDIYDVEQVGMADDMSRKADSAAIAKEFEPFKSYNQYDYVTHNGRLYQFITSHGSCLWNASEVTQISYSPFASTANYAVGDYVLYNGTLYQFTSAHGGSVWDANHVSAVTSTAFATGTAYAVGDHVTYNGNLYRFISAHTDGNWKSSEVSQLTISPFDTANSYSIGDYVTYNDVLYQFTSAHENGDWDANDVEEITLAAFATDTDYSIGDYVTYNDGVYQFISEHSGGSWDENYTHEIPCDDFAISIAYTNGDCVKYDNNYYIFNKPHTNGEWNQAETLPITVQAFQTGVEYAEGDYVTYNNGYYQFTEDHTNGAWDEDEVKSVTITPFTTGTAYAVGDMVSYNNGYYQFTSAHVDGAWNDTEVVNTNATEFSEETHYFIGDYVVYDGNYYCFTNLHTADVWDINDVVPIEVESFTNAENYGISDYVVRNGELYYFTKYHTGSAWNSEEVSEITVNAFNAEDSYSIDDYVSRNNNYYQFITNHEGSAWDASQVTEIETDDFSTVEDYEPGDYVVYSDGLYQFTTDHTGSAWNADEVAQITVNAFSTGDDYVIGDYVLYDDDVYQFTAPKQGGAWDSTEVEQIAYTVFSGDDDYEIGDYVEHDGSIYQFTSAHSNGHWNSSQMTVIEYDTFTNTDNYNVGDYVAYNDNVYIFTSGHKGSAWDSSEVTMIEYDAFSTTKDYAVGDYVEYNGNVYVFTSAHNSGAFKASEATRLYCEEFSGVNYAVGDYVWYEGNIYKFTSAHAGSEWNPSEVQELTLLDIQSGTGIIANEFKDNVAYASGDYVVYMGSLYRFTSAHSAGAWNASQVTLASVSGELKKFLPLSGGTMTGDVVFGNSGTTTRQIRFQVGDNDYGRIAVGATASNAGWMEIATADDANEPIYVRQYNSGVYGNIVRTLTLLDASGNTTLPGTLNVHSGFNSYALQLSKGNLTVQSATVTRVGLDICGPTYGNTASELKSNTAGVISYGDGGPQIRFSSGTTPGTGQSGAIIYTDHDAAGAGVSWNFVTDQGDCYVNAKHFKGTLVGNATNVTGTVAIGNGGTGATTAANARTNLGITPANIGALPTGGGTMTGQVTFAVGAKNAIAYQGTQAKYNMITFYDNTADAYGNGIAIGGGGLTVIGGGESATNAAASISTAGSEQLILCNDGAIDIWTNCQNGAASATKKQINTSGNFTGGSAYCTDKTNGTATYLNYGAAGLSSTSWFAAWNGYELRGISPANLKTTCGITGIAARPDYSISTTDLTAGTSNLTTNQLYFVYI